MKRRVFPKTTPFHMKKKEKKEKKRKGPNGDVLNGTVPLSSSPRTCSKHGKKVCLISRCPSFLACADKTRSPYTSDDAKPGGPRLDQPRSPTSRPALFCSPRCPAQPTLSCSPRCPCSAHAASLPLPDYKRRGRLEARGKKRRKRKKKTEVRKEREERERT